MLNKLILSSMGLAVLTLSGCTSKPRDVVASVPLVSLSQEKPDKQEIPLKYWNALSDPMRSHVGHDKYTIELNALYISALGQTCRELLITESNEDDIAKTKSVRRTACETTFMNKDKTVEKAWFLEQQIIESRLYVEL